MKRNGKLILFTLILMALATACKYFFGPNLSWSGFSPVIAIALFSGLIIKERNMSFLLPLLSLLISDALIELLYLGGQFPYPGLYGGQWMNYMILLTSTFIGWVLKGNNYTSLTVGAIAAPSFYFLLSNFFVWLNANELLYSRNFGGLVNCYEAGLPFYRNSLIATLLFLPVILFIYNYLTKRKAELVLA